MFSVVVTERGGAQRRVDFESSEVTIGRVQGNDIILPKGNVSKRHCRIVHKDGRFVVVDLKSTNGTYVNGRKLTSPLVVRSGDKIYVGDFIIAIDQPELQGIAEEVEEPRTSAQLAAQPAAEAATRYDVTDDQVPDDYGAPDEAPAAPAYAGNQPAAPPYDEQEAYPPQNYAEPEGLEDFEELASDDDEDDDEGTEGPVPPEAMYTIAQRDEDAFEKLEQQGLEPESAQTQAEDGFLDEMLAPEPAPASPRHSAQPGPVRTTVRADASEPPLSYARPSAQPGPRQESMRPESARSESLRPAHAQPPAEPQPARRQTSRPSSRPESAPAPAAHVQAVPGHSVPSQAPPGQRRHRPTAEGLGARAPLRPSMEAGRVAAPSADGAAQLTPGAARRGAAPDGGRYGRLIELAIDALGTQPNDIDADAVIGALKGALSRLDEEQPLAGDELSRLRDRAIRELAGLGPLEVLLDDESLVFACVDGQGQVAADFGEGLAPLQPGFASPRAWRLCAERLRSRFKPTLASGAFEGALNGGARALLLEAPLAPQGAMLEVHRRLRTQTLTGLVQRGVLDAAQAKVLEGAVRGGQGIAVLAATRHALATVVGALAETLPSEQRIALLQGPEAIALNQPYCVELAFLAGGPQAQLNRLDVALALAVDALVTPIMTPDQLPDALQRLGAFVGTVLAGVLTRAPSRGKEALEHILASANLSPARRQQLIAEHFAYVLTVDLVDGQPQVTAIEST